VAYLRSLFQADGYVSVRRHGDYENARIGFAVIGERWTEDVQLLLNMLGIYSRRTHKVEKRDDRHDMHEWLSRSAPSAPVSLSSLDSSEATSRTSC